MNKCTRKILGFVVYCYWLCCIVSNSPTHTFHHHPSLFVLYNSVSNHWVLFFYCYVIFLQWNLDVLRDRKQIDRSNPRFQRKCCSEPKISKNWNNLFSPVCLLYRRFLFYIVAVFFNIRRWPCFQSYGPCFVKAWIYSTLNRDPLAFTERSAWHERSSGGIVGQHQSQL